MLAELVSRMRRQRSLPFTSRSLARCFTVAVRPSKSVTLWSVAAGPAGRAARSPCAVVGAIAPRHPSTPARGRQVMVESLGARAMVTCHHRYRNQKEHLVHPTALTGMRDAIEKFMPTDRHYRVVDFGSYLAREGPGHRDVLADRDCAILGVDLMAGRNVDIVMDLPYRIPLPSNTADVVLSGQVFEHIPFIFTSALEIRRILKPGGLFMMTVPSRGHRHNVYDCWRFYPDSMRAIAAFTSMELEHAVTDLPKRNENGRYDYSKTKTYWGDTVGVFRKPRRSPRIRIAMVSAALRYWSNRVGDLEDTPLPRSKPPW